MSPKLSLFLGLSLWAPASVAQESAPVEAPLKMTTVPPVSKVGDQLDSESRLVLRAISQKYKKLQNWEANFSQENFSVGLGKGSYSEGRFVFEAPNRFRYSVMKPEANASDFISDGKQAWQVTYKEGRGKLAFVRHALKVASLDLEKYLLLLRGIDAVTPAKEAKLLKSFDIKGKKDGDNLVLTLVPKESSELTKVELFFKNSEDVLSKAVLTDALENRTTVTIVVHRKLKAAPAGSFAPDFPKDSKVEKL